MGWFKLEHSRFVYRLDFAAYGADVVGLAIWLALSAAPGSRAALGGCVVVGWLAYFLAAVFAEKALWLGIAAVRGFQGDATFKDKKRVIATLKHFAAHGQPESGQNCAPVNVSERVLRETFLHPFKDCLQKAGAISVMASYNEIDGVPSHASEWLLRKVLRGEVHISEKMASAMVVKFVQGAEPPPPSPLDGRWRSAGARSGALFRPRSPSQPPCSSCTSRCSRRTCCRSTTISSLWR